MQQDLEQAGPDDNLEPELSVIFTDMRLLVKRVGKGDLIHDIIESYTQILLTVEIHCWQAVYERNLEKMDRIIDFLVDTEPLVCEKNLSEKLRVTICNVSIGFGVLQKNDAINRVLCNPGTMDLLDFLKGQKSVTLAFIEKNLKVKAIKGSLQSLCDAGLVEMTVNFDESLYSITAEGRKQLRLRAK